MSKRKFELKAEEASQLRRAEQETRDVAELKRLQSVRMYGPGHSVRSIQEVVGCSESSLRSWVGKYKRLGRKGLSSQYERSAQNASKLSVVERQEISELLHSYRPDQVIPPQERKREGRFWTVSDMRQIIMNKYGVVYKDESSYTALLHECGFSYQRAEKVYKSRPSEVVLVEFEAELEKK